MANTSLKQIIQAFCSDETAFYGGTVITKKPLSVMLQNDSNLKIGEALLIIPEHLTDHNVKMKIDGTEKTVKIYEGLKKGDDVIVVSINRGDQYLIVGRF